jgi:hypothetical protein
LRPDSALAWLEDPGVLFLGLENEISRFLRVKQFGLGFPLWYLSKNCKLTIKLIGRPEGRYAGDPPGGPLEGSPGTSLGGIPGGDPPGGFPDVPQRFWDESGSILVRFCGDSGLILAWFWVETGSIRVISFAFLPHSPRGSGS